MTEILRKILNTSEREKKKIPKDENKVPPNFLSIMNAKLEDKGAIPLHLESGSLYPFNLAKQI